MALIFEHSGQQMIAVQEAKRKGEIRAALVDKVIYRAVQNRRKISVVYTT